MLKRIFSQKRLAVLTTIVLILGTIFSFVPQKALATTAWNALPSTGFDAAVTGISAISETAVWACGADNDSSGDIARYNGYTWTHQTIPTSVVLWDISMASSSVGVAVGASDGTRGVILYTSNGGTTWTQSTDASIPNVNLLGVSMASTTVGWAVGQDASGTETVLYTSDGGVNWDTQTASASGNVDFNDVDAVSTSVAVLCGQSDGTRGTIFYTSNGGTTWTQHTDADIPGVDLNGVYVASTSVAFVVGNTTNLGLGNDQGTILSTTNLSGGTWDISFDSTIPEQNLSGVDGTSTTRVWVGGANDTMLETSDGNDWDINSVPSNTNLCRRLSAESADHVYGTCSGSDYVIASFDITGHDVEFDLGIAITISLDSTASYDFGTVIPEVIYTSPDNVRTVNVKTNNPTGWVLYIKGLGNFTSGANSVNLSVLEWASDSTVWTDTTTSDTMVTSDANPTGSGGVDTGMEYRLNTVPFGTPVANNYTTTITYTAATQ